MGEDTDEATPLLRDVERQQSGNGAGTSSSSASTAVAEPAHPDAPLPDDDDSSAARQLEVGDVHDTSFFRSGLDGDSGGGGGGGGVDVWKLAPLKWVPQPVRRVLTAAAEWSKGPPGRSGGGGGPRVWRIEPVLPAVQHFPLLALDAFLPRREQRAAVFLGFAALYVVSFGAVMRQGNTATEVSGYGKPSAIGCGNTYWVAGNRCGLDGNDCRPFNGTGFAFKCPAGCAGYQLLNHRAVGDQELIYRPLVVGGLPAPKEGAPDGGDGGELGGRQEKTEAQAGKAIYRGDSFICGAAIHAGIVSNVAGGCGVVETVGRRSGYPSSTAHGIESVGFDGSFPLSFAFQGGVECKSKDTRWTLLAISVVFTSIFSVFVASPALYFFTVFTALFWHVGLASDPPPHYSTPDLISDILGKYLPAMFVAWVMYDKMGVRRTLDGLTAQVEKTVLWLGFAWVGALENYTFRFVPIQRLTDHDLNQQPGAKFALAMIIILLVLIVAKQVWYFRQEGRLLRYLRVYGIFLAGILIALTLPDLKLRIHHYVLALLLLPGTAMQTRPALVYQGLLVGLFVNGIARWGFDPVLQTDWQLQGDAPHNSPLPSILPPVVAPNATAIAFAWQPPPGPRYDGISVLVNDVERYRVYFSDGDDGLFDAAKFVWPRKEGSRVNEYFRFGYMEGSKSWDYTRAGVWNEDGEWVPMAPGPSMIRSGGEDDDDGAVLLKVK